MYGLGGDSKNQEHTYFSAILKKSELQTYRHTKCTYEDYRIP